MQLEKYSSPIILLHVYNFKILFNSYNFCNLKNFKYKSFSKTYNSYNFSKFLISYNLLQSFLLNNFYISPRRLTLPPPRTPNNIKTFTTNKIPHKLSTTLTTITVLLSTPPPQFQQLITVSDIPNENSNHLLTLTINRNPKTFHITHNYHNYNSYSDSDNPPEKWNHPSTFTTTKTP